MKELEELFCKKKQKKTIGNIEEKKKKNKMTEKEKLIRKKAKEGISCFLFQQSCKVFPFLLWGTVRNFKLGPE